MFLFKNFLPTSHVLLEWVDFASDVEASPNTLCSYCQVFGTLDSQINQMVLGSGFWENYMSSCLVSDFSRSSIEPKSSYFVRTSRAE